MVFQHRKNRQRHSFDVIELLLCAILLCAFVYVAYVIFAKWNPYLTNSDVVNEIVFREMTWEQKTLFPEGYIAGHELLSNRPILIWWLFYAFTKNTMLSFRLENLCVLLLQLLAVGLLLKKLRLTRRTVLFGTTIYLAWLLGHANNMMLFWQMDANATHALIVFVTLTLRITLYENCTEPESDKGKRLAVIAGMVALSALAGYTTVKMAMVLYVPLFLADGVKLFLTYTNDREISRREISAMMLDAILLLVNVAFYAICLARYGDRFWPRTINIVPVSSWLSWPVISAQLESLIFAFGYRGGGSLGSISGISFFLGGLLMVIQIYAILWLALTHRNHEERKRIADVIGYWLAATVTVFCVQLFPGEVGKTPRYYFVTSILQPVILAYALEMWGRRARRFNLPMVMGTASCAALLVVTVLYNRPLFTSQPPVLVQAANYMQENGYRYVAASYWNAGVITGYTEGEVDALHGYVNTMETHNWAIDQRKFDQERIGEPGILLLTDDEEAAVDPYVAYMLQNYTQKVQEFGPYNLYAVQENPFTLILKVHKNSAGLPTDGDFKTDKPNAMGFIYQGAEITENGELISKEEGGTILYGPYTQSVPGTYDITLRYEVESSSGTDTGIFDVALDNVQQSAAAIDPQNTEAVLKGVKIEAGHRFEARVWVPQGMIIRVQSIEYSRID